MLMTVALFMFKQSCCDVSPVRTALDQLFRLFLGAYIRQKEQRKVLFSSLYVTRFLLMFTS